MAGITQANKVMRIAGQFRVFIQVFDVVYCGSLPHSAVAFAILALVVIPAQDALPYALPPLSVVKLRSDIYQDTHACIHHDLQTNWELHSNAQWQDYQCTP